MSEEKLKKVVIREELMAISDDFIEAIILNQMLYWTERVNDYDKYIKEEKERIEKYAMLPQDNIPYDYLLSHGWIYKKASELKEELMNLTSEDTINRRLSNLVKKGFLDRRNNPKIKYDRTYQYRVNFKNLSIALIKKGYILQDYKIDLVTLYNLCKTVFETHEPQNAECNSEPQNAETSNEENEKQLEQANLDNPQTAVLKSRTASAIPETTNRDYPLQDSVSLESRSSTNKLDSRIKISLQDQSLWCSDTKINNLNTDINSPDTTESNYIYNIKLNIRNKLNTVPYISLNKTLSLKPDIEPNTSLNAPVSKPDKELDTKPENSLDKLDMDHSTPISELDKEPVNKPVSSTVTMFKDEAGKILNNSLNKPEKDLNNALDMPNDAVKEPDAINVDDLDDDFLKLDDELFESEEYKEFFAMLDAMPNPDDASKASLEMSYSELDRELKTVSNQKPDTSLNAPEEKLERNVIMPDDALSEFDSEPEYELESALSEPVAMNTAQSLQKDNNLQECPFAEDTNSFTSAAGKINCDTDRYGLHLLDKARKIQEQRNIALDADNDADLMLHHFVDENSAQCLESVPEGKEVSYSYGNWSDYAIEETDDDGTIISSGQFKQDCDVFENLDDDWKAFEEAGFTVIDELDESNTEKQADIDDDWRVFEEAGFMVVDELDASSIKNAEQQADAENELAKMLEEAFNARIVDRTENDIVSVMSRTEKHVDNTESEFEKMLEEAFDAKIVYHDADSAMSKPEKLPDAETNNPEELPNVGTIKPVDEPEKLLDEEVDKALTELKKVPESQVLNEHEKMLDAEVGETINEPEEMPDAETSNEHEKLSKAKVVSLVDRLEKLPNSEIGGFANKPEKMLKYGTNKALSELEKSLKAKTVRALSRLDRPAGISHSRQNRVIQECHISSMFTSAVKKEKATGISCIDFGELELAVNAGIRKQWKTVRGSPPVKANCIEIFKNLFAMSKQKHRNLTFACEGGN